ncbi:hypothetical protein [Glycomyces paridis]|uniref:Uncharacterized protein n=1 Tax=Glycomyces paridis TaxID=2126555 RepID=A0A4S8PMJ9_9ACTN|nr:hypothetical protein [Glycomyces paridis]THV29524.1 hypothetical protein E9998_08435 [Glycomyces paridis]
MPKAAAERPLEWATGRYGWDGFDLRELDRVVLDYAPIELALAKRWSRRSALGRACAGAVFALSLIGLMAAVLMGIATLAGVDGEALPVLVFACSGLGCAAVAGFFVPWLLTPYRQWDRTLCGLSVMIAVSAAASIVSVLARDLEAGPPWLLAAPCLVLLLAALGAIVGDVRLRTDAKPPPVDLAALTPDELDVLLAVRRKTLRVLRSRGVVSYPDCAAFEKAPLDPS